MKSKSALFVDPSLHSRDGHHFYALKRLQFEFDELGIPHKSLVSKYANDEVVRELTATPCFERGIYARVSWTQSEFDEHVKLFAGQLTAAVKQLRLKPDFLILPCSDQVVAAGLARHLTRHPGARPDILMWLLLPPSFRHGMDGSLAEKLLAEYGTAFGELRQALKDIKRLHLYCETPSMAATYEAATGVKAGIAPTANMIFKPRRKSRVSDMAPTILCAGNVNRAKGYALLPETIRQVHGTRPDIQFIIHGTVTATDFPEAKEIFAALAAMGGNVTTLTHHLPSDEYESLLAKADFVLFPYDPTLYLDRGSGLFSETVALGIPAIAPSMCAFARAAIDGGRAAGIDEYSAPGAAAAILKAAQRLDQLTERAQSFALENHPSTGDLVRNFVAAANRPERGPAGLLDRLLRRRPFRREHSKDSSST